MLLGVRERRASELVAAGHPLRVYVPYGQQWYEYSLRRLQENPRMAGVDREGDDRARSSARRARARPTPRATSGACELPLGRTWRPRSVSLEGPPAGLFRDFVELACLGHASSCGQADA